MKKLFAILVLAICAISVASCTFGTPGAASIEDVMEDFFCEVDFENVTSNLDFAEKVNGVNISYESSKPEVISNEGVVVRQKEEQVVQVTVKFELNGATGLRVYEFVVPAKGPDALKEVKEFSEGQEVYVKGVVAFVVYGTTKNIPVGFYLYDDADAIYVYSSEFAKVVEAGDEVEIEGYFTKYIDEASLSSAQYAGYTGARQIVPSSCEVLSKGNEINTEFVESTSIAALCQIPVSENITANVYKVVARINRSQGNGFVNYYFNDLNGVDSYYAYTTANGADLEWLNEYDGEVRECIIAVQNCKLSASGNFWRIVPLQILDEVEVSDETYALYALDRLEKQFADSYNAVCDFDVVATDKILEGSKVTYEAKSEGVTIKEVENGYNVALNFNEEKVVLSVVISVEYKGVNYSREVSFECAVERPSFDTISIEEARTVATGEKALIAGYIVGFLYMKGGSTPAGFELIDETSSIAVFISTAVDAETDINKLQKGEYVVVEGYGDLYQPREDYKHTGSIRLNNAEVLYHDWVAHEIPSEWIEEMSMKDLVTNPSDNNISNKVYKTTMYVEKSSGSYVNYYIHALEDPSLSMIVYSQNSNSTGPAEYAWLSEYAGKCVEAYVTLRIGAKSSGAFIWKAGVLEVLQVVPTPDHLVAGFAKEDLVGKFAAEYPSVAKVTYDVPAGATLTVKEVSSTQVTAKVENGVLTVDVKEPTTTETVKLVLNFKLGEYNEDITVSFNVVKASVIALNDFRAQAAKNGPTVVVEGIVCGLVKSSGASKWTFYVTDGTATILSYSQAAVQVGDKVRIQGNIDIYYGLPQISKGTVEILSSGNVIPQDSFKVNAKLADVASDAKAGEAAKNGGLVYTNVVGTLNITTSGEKVSITSGDTEVVMYNYTNAKFYAENYQPLEALAGKEVKVTLVSYNWYQTQYTYIITSCEAI